MLNVFLNIVSYLAIGGVIAGGLWIMLEMLYQGWGPKARFGRIDRVKHDRLCIVGDAPGHRTTAKPVVAAHAPARRKNPGTDANSRAKCA